MSVQKRRFPRKGESHSYWVIDFVFRHADGRRERIRKNSPVQTRRGAEQYEREVREALLTKGEEKRRRAAQRAQKGAAKTLPCPRVDQFLAEFIKTYATANNKPSEVDSKRSVIKNHLIPFFGTKRLSAISARDIESFKADRLSRGLAPKTINNVLAVLGRSLRVAKQWELLQSTPEIRALRLPLLEHDHLSFVEADRLIEAAEPGHWRSMITLALRTGLRLGELRALQWQDVDLAARKLIVRRAAWMNVVGTPKSGRAREVTLSRQATAALQALRHADTPWVFASENGQLLAKGACRWPLWRAARQADLGRTVGWHLLRHTFASHLAMRGAPLRAVQELLGHADIKMTMRYAHLNPSAKQEAVDLID